jgi:preprotein translocase subunit SecG
MSQSKMTIFFANALMLANLSSKSHKSISSKIEKSEPSPVENSTDSSSLPIAK